ncbi:MAG: phage antirepressor KilAC domain-containing protein [Spirosomaceae bacterium]|jgi:phage antirepressor YoqD-like protein|nr:phage antirepressor KilAC domain-containing protein [Spirosomataceae bacterium]
MTKYTVKQAAELLNLQQKQLFGFLRRYNFISGTTASLEFVLAGYFEQHTKDIYVGHGYIRRDQVLITEKGIKWLEKVIKLLTINYYSK